MDTYAPSAVEQVNRFYMRKKNQYISSFLNHIASIEKFDSLLLQFLFQEALYENWNTSV